MKYNVTDYISLMKNKKDMCQYACYKQHSDFLDKSNLTLCKRDSNDELSEVIHAEQQLQQMKQKKDDKSLFTESD